MSYLSDFLKNGSTLQGKAGSVAIPSGSLLLLNSLGQLAPVKVSDYAAVANVGASVVAATTVSSFTTTIASQANERDSMAISPVDASIFIGTGYLTAADGMRVFKYSASGTLLGSVILDTTSAAQTHAPSIKFLSNGNIVISWMIAAGNLYFAIVDPTLNIIVAATSIDTPTGIFYHMTALSGGGFAITYNKTGAFLAIYGNTGSVTFAGTIIGSSPTTNSNGRITQLSNGNLALAITSTTASKALGYAISTVIGTQVVAYTNLDSATAAAIVLGDISSLTGFFAIGAENGTNATAYVLSNAGILQGSGYSHADADGAYVPKMMNDGVNFWYLTATTATTVHKLGFLPTSGTGFVTNTLTVSGAGVYDAYYDNGSIVTWGSSAINVITLQSIGVAFVASTISHLGSVGSAGWCIKPCGDYCHIVVQRATTTVFAIQKYQNSSVVGVSQQAVAANNANALVNFSEGPGGYPCNPILGTVGKAFDHSASNIIGNKGTFLSNSVSLKGI